MRIGIMTGGGDAPGLNGIIEAAARVLLRNGAEVVGIRDGFEGVFEGRTKPVTLETILGIHSEAGTYLGTSNKSKLTGRAEEFQAGFKQLKLDGLIAAGGDGTFKGLRELAPNVKVIGVPKTIDNDIQGTEVTFGYDTACAVVSDSVDSLRATANAHHRVMVVETMGRTAGWIALGGGLSSYADVILIPERPFSREKLAKFLSDAHAAGKPGMVVVVSEAAKAVGEDAVFTESKGHSTGIRFGGVGERLARWIESNSPWEARHVVLGHLQRARYPTTTDRFLTASMGAKAATLALSHQWNRAVVYRDGKVTDAPLIEIQGEPREVAPDHRWVRLCEALGIFI
ncbi:MAG: ATP-dependent 6-phosphofructokinase [Proteobacteria bacterium]|nr:ATP-dependent 6-phosphofructokinase [Pseudomonadota bacterium]